MSTKVLTMDPLLNLAPWLEFDRSVRHWTLSLQFHRHFYESQKKHLESDMRLGNHIQLIALTFTAAKGPPRPLPTHVRLAPAGSASVRRGVFPVSAAPSAAPSRLSRKEKDAIEAMLRPAQETQSISGVGCLRIVVGQSWSKTQSKSEHFNTHGWGWQDGPGQAV